MQNMHYALMCIMHNEMNCQGGVGRRGGMPIMNAAKTSVNLDKGSGQGAVAEDMSKPPRKKLDKKVDKEGFELVLSHFFVFFLHLACSFPPFFLPSKFHGLFSFFSFSKLILHSWRRTAS